MKQLSVPFKIYADFESVLKGLIEEMIEVMVLLMPKNIRNIFLVVLFTKLYVLMIDSGSQLLLTEEQMNSINLLEKFLKKMNITKRW